MNPELSVLFGGASFATAACANVEGLKDESSTDNLRQFGGSAIDRRGHFRLRRVENFYRLPSRRCSVL